MQIGTRGPIVSLKWNDESAKKAWHVKFCSSSLSQGEIEAQWAIGRGNRRDADSRAADYRYGKEKKVTREEGRGEEKEERSVHTQSNSRIWFCYSVNYTPWTWASLQSTRVMRIIALRFLARRHFREGGGKGGPPFNIHPSVRAGAFFDSFRWFNSRCSALRPIPPPDFRRKISRDD